ncbi:MAG: DegT/DnrJ/EryC1/StrS family aminotransferase [Candidatus Electrothrix scaldis]|nr:MAG: DegT/DnrJ/EryC1/StrS family aminotransferase [Candidatus Electrothrix sp. GW3-3]
MQAEQLYQSPNKLAPLYSRFRVAERLLLTGHSHQAWPDCAFDGQVLAWEDAACYVDEKWERAFAQAQAVKAGFAGLIGDHERNITLGSNTHELVTKFLSALPLGKRPKLITTDGEFHTIRRQLDRLGEEGVQIIKVPSSPAADLVERMRSAIDEKTAAVLISKVFYHSAVIVKDLDRLADRCQEVGSELLVDAYHALNVVPFSVINEGLASAFIVGGGYKYCQLGEGNCFLRVPPGCTLRPVITGWFAEFDILSQQRQDNRVPYPSDAARFAGSTYDPTSHYRGAKVFEFFHRYQLSPEFLRTINQHQIKHLLSCFDALDVDPTLIDYDRSIAPDDRGGFLVLHTPHAHILQHLLKQRGVHTDHRGTSLRLGPAPYLSDAQLSTAMQILGEILRERF